MNAFNPGEGWREATEIIDWTEAEVVEFEPGGGDPVRWWVPIEMRQALPTEPYTVIRVTWHDPESTRPVWTLREDGYWGDYFGTWRPDRLMELITGFEVLAEPVQDYQPGYVVIESKLREQVRRETAKAIVADIRDRDESLHLVLAEIERTYGAES